MQHSTTNVKQAKRLGITLPQGDEVTVDEGWTSDGQDSLFEGPCKLDRRSFDGRWTVSLRRSGKKGGYRKAATCASLFEAVELAKFLRNRENRRAFRGFAPKVADAPQAATDPQAALREALGKVNGEAVQVS